MTAAQQSGRSPILGANNPNHLGMWRGFFLPPDRRRTGAMYLVFAVAAGLIAGALSLSGRAEVVAPSIAALAPRYGAIVAFYAIIPALIGGLGGWFVPVMVGAEAMAFPRMHGIAFWLLALSFALLLTSLFVASDSVDVARDPMIGASRAMPWALASIYVACASSILLSINFITTIFNMRAPRVTLQGLPILVWSILVSAILLLLWPPVVAGAAELLSASAPIGTGFVASDLGGYLISDPHLFLLLFHPEMFILVLISFGIVCEIVCMSSNKPALTYRATAVAMAAIGLIGFLMWARRIYAGASAADSYPALLALVIAVPASIMIVSWFIALSKARVSLRTPLLWASGFIFLFAAGGVISVIRAGLGTEPMPQDGYSVLAEFQDVLLLSSMFAVFAAWYYWFPKITGLMYNEALGKLHFWVTFIGVNLVSITQYFPNPAGMFRQYFDFQESDASWHQSTVVGSYITAAGVAIFLVCMAEALVRRQLANQNPWKAVTPEWTSSSVPLFQFASLNRLGLYVPIALVAISIALAAILVPVFQVPPLQLGQLARENPRLAPDVAFTNLAGDTHHLSEFRGRFILLNLWGTWCAPCVREMPSLALLSITMPRDRFLVVAVALPPGSAKETSDFLATHDASVLPTYVDSDMTAYNVFHAYGLPLTVLIDPQGHEIARAQGPVEWGAPETVEFLKTLSGIR